MKSKSVFIKGRDEAIENVLNEAEVFCGKCGTLSRKQRNLITGAGADA